MAAVRALVAPRLAAASTFAPLPGLRPLLPHKPAPSPRAALHGSAPRPGAKVALVLSGCGVYDGTELHEASAALVHLSRGGAEVQIFAPDIPQMHVIDHTKGQPSESESRNVLKESARIARGKITDLAQLSAANHDAAIFPGGFGAAKNLSTFAVDGKDCKVNRDVERVLKEFHKAGKPIGKERGLSASRRFPRPSFPDPNLYQHPSRCLHLPMLTQQPSSCCNYHPCCVSLWRPRFLMELHMGHMSRPKMGKAGYTCNQERASETCDGDPVVRPDLIRRPSPRALRLLPGSCVLPCYWQIPSVRAGGRLQSTPLPMGSVSDPSSLTCGLSSCHPGSGLLPGPPGRGPVWRAVAMLHVPPGPLSLEQPQLCGKCPGGSGPFPVTGPEGQQIGQKLSSLCCIAPVLAAKVLRGVEVTVGHEQEEGGKWPYAGTAEAIKALGAKHCVKGVTEAHVDQKNKVVTTPAFMCETELHHIHDGIGAMVAKVLELARK